VSEHDFTQYMQACEDGVVRMCGLEKRTTPIGGITYLRDGVPCSVPQWKSDELPDCPVIPRAQWRTTEGMKPWEWSNRYQNGYPACCLAALCGAVEFFLAKNGRARTKLDWLKAWKDITGGRGGAAVDYALAYAMEKGLPLADGSGVIKIVEAWDSPSVDAFASGLQKDCTGLACHDVHAECVVGLDVSGSKPQVQMVNSHHQDLGGKNWHLFPVDAIELSSYGAILIREVELRKIDVPNYPDAKE
jgi:hypothetical protein